MENPVTTNLAEFGIRERELAEELLSAWNGQGLPEEFWDEGVEIAFNSHSGYVFLTNEDYQVCMMNEDKLEKFYSCPICGAEGFWEDVKEIDQHTSREYSDECQDWINDIAEMKGE